MINSEFRARWHNYYTEKRILHQWKQVDLLRPLSVERVLEIGPYMGLVTAMLASAGYDVSTLDISPESSGVNVKNHIEADIRSVDPACLVGYDVFLCCETLEHIPWCGVGNILNRLSNSEVPWLILSVPYEGFQFSFNLYLNRYIFRRSSAFRKLRFLRTFPRITSADWEPHKWEIGYRGFPLSRLESKLAKCGYDVQRRAFTAGCRSVFLICRNQSARDLA